MANQQPCVLAVMAHPDDIEILCAGTLCRLRDLGWRVALATMTHGDCGSADLGPAEISAIRTAEAEASAARLGASYHCLDQLDLFVLFNEPTLKATVELLRQVRPDVLVTHSPQDYMLDHEQTSVLVRDAACGAPIKNVFTGAADPAAPLDHIPTLYYADPIEGLDALGNRITPGFYVDISATIDRKEQLLACHASQRDWLLKHHGIDEYLRSMRHWCEVRGAEVGVAYAEAFRQHLGHAYPADNVIGEALGALRP
ncbi:MAG: PIG-L family deacetylase [Fimbriimonadaceae bacterium]|nr:PIG-L family deacetylase [Fimbriimonadaceae bacterium]